MSQEPEDAEHVDAVKRQRLTPEARPAKSATASPAGTQRGSENLNPLAQESARDEPFEQVRQLKEHRELQKQREAELRKRITDLEGNIKSFNACLDRSRDEYEDLVPKYRALRKEQESSKKTIEALERQRDQQREDISRLRQTQTQLERDLASARDELRGSAVPEIASLEEARSAARQATAEQRRLTQRLESTLREFEFVRAQYQIASKAAAESAAEVSELRGQVETLERRANGEAVKLRQINVAAMADMHARELAALKNTVEDRDRLLRKKEETIMAMSVALAGSGGGDGGMAATGAGGGGTAGVVGVGVGARASPTRNTGVIERTRSRGSLPSGSGFVTPEPRPSPGPGPGPGTRPRSGSRPGSFSRG